MGRKITYIFGLGSGRCGTMSLSKILSYQIKTNITHEKIRLPWKIDIYRLNQLLSIFVHDKTQNQFIGDVAFYYLNYIDLIIQKLNNVKFICLIRDYNEILKSFLIKTKGYNHWDPNIPITKYEWYECFPKYHNMNKTKSIKRYIKEYYQKCYYYQNKYPNVFKIFSINDLNTIDGQNKIFDFINFNNPRKYNLNIKLNYSVN